MAQLRIYKSTDTGAPTLNGNTGSLLTLLDACLVNGYGTQPAAGWLKPIANTGSYGCYQLPSGSTGHFLFVDDAGSGSAAGAEARITGWDTITSFNGEAVTGSNRFPTYAQVAISRGSMIVRKSRVATASSVNWIMMADSRSLYGFVLTNDTAGVYMSFMFGEYYSLQGASDATRAMIVGRAVISSSAIGGENLDRVNNTLGTVTTGHYGPHSFGGGGSSINLGTIGDTAKGNQSTVLNGAVTYMNGADAGLYISPVWVNDTSFTLRGRMRGFYHFLHAISNVADQQEFTGSADSSYSGSTFLVIKSTGNAGVYFMETSDTLETNY